MTEYVSVVTVEGKNRALKLLFGGTDDAMLYMGVGSGTTDPTDGSTGLSNEFSIGVNGYERVVVTPTYPDDPEGVDQEVRLEGEFGVGNLTSSVDINEIAIFDASSSGTPFCICRIPATVKDSSKTVKFIITNSVA